MQLVYSFLFRIFFLLSAPYYFWRMWRRGNWQRGFAQRLGRYDSGLKQAITNREVIWFHAVSVGEVNICTQLIRALELKMPNLKIVVSTTTTTGMAELQRKLPGHIIKIYYPIDDRNFVSRALGVIHPSAIVLVEAEIWPNFLWQATRARIPLFLVNARLSERSVRGYRRFGFIFRPLFASFSGVGCQNQADVENLASLGFRREVIQLVGNLKFDAAKIDEVTRLDVEALLEQIGVSPTAPILVGGSTHAGEETILAEMFLRLKKTFPDLFLIVVPRHAERGGEVGRDLARVGLRFLFRNQLTITTCHPAGSIDCLLVNTTGELKYFYQHASVIFVGKSLTAEGGQSPIEPGGLGKAMVFGPHMQNFLAISAAFVAQGGAIQVENAQQLEEAVSTLLGDEKRRAQMGRNAQKVVQENLGGIERTVEMMVPHLSKKAR